MPLSEFPRPQETATGNDPPEVRVPPPGPMSRAMAGRLAEVECPAFGQRRKDRSEGSGVDLGPIVLASGRGSNLYDVDGNRYVDLAAGFGSLLLGHGATSTTRALEGQADQARKRADEESTPAERWRLLAEAQAREDEAQAMRYWLVQRFGPNLEAAARDMAAAWLHVRPEVVQSLGLPDT